MLVYLKLFVTACFWGGTFVAGRAVAAHMGPFSAAFLRFVLASACMWWITRRRAGGLPRLTRRQLPLVILLGLTGVFAYNALFFTGLRTVPAGRAAIIVATNPVWIGLLAAVLFKETLTWFKALGIALSVSGAVVVISQGDPLALFSTGLTLGDVAILGCVASWVAYSLLGKQVMKDLSPHGAVTYSCVAGTLFLAVPAGLEGVFADLWTLPWQAWAQIGYLGVFGTVLGFTWFYEGVKEIGASRAAVFINIVPISAMVSAYLILGEAVSVSLGLGAALVLCGVWLANRRTSPS